MQRKLDIGGVNTLMLSFMMLLKAIEHTKHWDSSFSRDFMALAIPQAQDEFNMTLFAN